MSGAAGKGSLLSVLGLCFFGFSSLGLSFACATPRPLPEWIEERPVHGIPIQIAVRDREVIAVEAIEGTDRMTQRAGELCPRGGWTMVKVAKPNQDMRFDVPTVGLRTIEHLKAAGGACLALQAGKVIMTDKPQPIEAADKAGVVIVGVDV